MASGVLDPTTSFVFVLILSRFSYLNLVLPLPDPHENLWRTRRQKWLSPTVPHLAGCGKRQERREEELKYSESRMMENAGPRYNAHERGEKQHRREQKMNEKLRDSEY